MSLSSRTIGILALQGAYQAHAKTVQALGANPKLVRLPADLEGPDGSPLVDGLIMPGGESTTMLKFLEPRLAPGAIVIADDLDIAPEALAPYLAHVRAAGNGYVSVELPLGDRIEISLRG